MPDGRLVVHDVQPWLCGRYLHVTPLDTQAKESRSLRFLAAAVVKVVGLAPRVMRSIEAKQQRHNVSQNANTQQQLLRTSDCAFALLICKACW